MTRHAPSSQGRARSGFGALSSDQASSRAGTMMTSSGKSPPHGHDDQDSSGNNNQGKAPQQSKETKLKHHVVPGGQGFAFKALKGTRFRVMDMFGSQVVDMAAWPLSSSSSSASDSDAKVAKLPSEHLSTSATRYRLSGNPPMIGECLYTNAFRPLLRLRQDLCGTHDMNYMCCCPEMYKLMGIENHSSCAVNICNAVNEYFASKAKDSSGTNGAHRDNLYQGNQADDCKGTDDGSKKEKQKVMQSHLDVPDPFNTFQNTPNYSLKPRAASRAGDYVDWEVLEDALVALSACPYTVFQFNGGKATNISVTWDQPLQEPWA